MITGNEDITKAESTIEWANLVSGFDTLVFLMGVKNIEQYARKLIEHGKPADTPAAVVRWGTRPDQKTVVGTLGDIAGQVKEERIRPPAVMVVGNVVKLRDTLKWYEKKPLFGKRILITRELYGRLRAAEELGAEIFEFPTIKTVPPASYASLDAAIDTVESYNWLVFSSANGFRFFMQRFLVKDRDIRDLKGIKLCAIGTKTAATIRSYGLKVDLVPVQFNAEGLLEAIIRETTGQGTKSNSLKGIRILLPRAEMAREIFPQRVRELGGEIDTPVAYRTVKPEKHGKRLKRFLKEGRIAVATFTSAATFANFIDMMGDDAMGLLKPAEIAAIGPVTKEAINKAGLKVSIMPEEATIKAMVNAIIEKYPRS